MKVCNFCHGNVLRSQLPWDEHHKEYATLATSHADSCVFCTTLLQDVEQNAKGLKEDTRRGEWPVYRWSVRRLAKFRESGEAIAITFRTIPRAREQSQGSPQTVNPEEVPAKVECATIKEDNVGSERPLPSRTFYLFPEEDLGPLPTAELLGKSTASSISGGSQVKSWIQACDSSHAGCSKRSKALASLGGFVPTRLLDISGPPRMPIKVVEAKASGIKGPYVTLSHCWGEKTFVTNTRKTEIQFREEGIPWTLLTRNFQEAIEVARFLGVSYMWIDSLCIIQGHDGDFGSEGVLMHHVYRNSYCNIAAADSRDSAGGLFRKRNASDVVLVRHKASDGNNPMYGQKTWRIVPKHLWESELLVEPLYRRGWVFQERMLAARIIHFAHRQIFWDCPSMSACEALPAGLPQPVDGAAGPDRHWRGRLQEPGALDHGPLAGANDDSLEYFWKVAVQKYTSCDPLTKGADKLVAIWGIARLVRDAYGSEYAAGLWEQGLAEQLTWRVAETKLDVRPSECTDDRRARNIPSWSWASMDGTIEVPDRWTDEPDYVVMDHFHRPLGFDLLAPKTYSSPKLNQERWPTQLRGMSDSIVELQKKWKEIEDRERYGEADQKAERQRHSSPEKISNRDEEPRLRNTQIPIQGHVGRGHLKWHATTRKHLLEIPGFTGGEIEAFPDTVVREGNPIDENPFFVVLVGRRTQVLSRRLSGAKSNQDSVQDAIKSDKDHDESTYSGAGVLMKSLEKSFHHYRRTGAFQFRNISGKAWKELQGTFDVECSPSDIYDPIKGLKFWLE